MAAVAACVGALAIALPSALAEVRAGRDGSSGTRIELVSARFTRDGQAPSGEGRPRVESSAHGERVHLPVDAMGTRWATSFTTDEAATHRLLLHWQPDARGMLFEVVLDGERQPPPRDGWRPSSRPLVSDLGPRWLGQGEHLLEFVAREQPAEGSGLTLGALELSPP